MFYIDKGWCAFYRKTYCPSWYHDLLCPETAEIYNRLLLCLILSSFSPSFWIISSPPPLFLLFCSTAVISTERRSTSIQCWRRRSAGSWSSWSSSSCHSCLKASSHLKVSATSEVRSSAPTKGVIIISFYFSVLFTCVCDWKSMHYVSTFIWHWNSFVTNPYFFFFFLHKDIF